MGTVLPAIPFVKRSEEHTSELQSRLHLVCRLLLEKKKQNNYATERNNHSRVTGLACVEVCGALCCRQCARVPSSPRQHAHTQSIFCFFFLNDGPPPNFPLFPPRPPFRS